MLVVICVVVLFVCGCKTIDESRWESSVHTSTKVFVDRPNAVEAIEMSASLKREW